MTTRGHHGLMLAGGGSPGASLFDLLMEDAALASESFYCRHGEASGSTMENEVSTDGVYQATATLGEPALYIGGPTSVLFTGGGSSGDIPASVMPASSVDELTLVTITEGAVTGTIQLISRDADAGDRLWQWRLVSGDMQWIKIVGGVTVTARTHGIVVDTPTMIGVTVTSAGVVSLFVNGSRLGTTDSIAPANYGSDTRKITINNRDGASEGGSRRFSESAGFNVAVSDARMLEYAQAAGFA